MVNFLVSLAFAIPISIVDIKTLKIPNKLLFVFCLTLVAIDVGSQAYFSVLFSLISSITIFLLFYAIYYIIGGIGFGDVKYASVIGYALGFQKGLFACLIASLIGILFFVVLYFVSLARQKIVPVNKKRIPFGPFLSFGLTILSIF